MKRNLVSMLLTVVVPFMAVANEVRVQQDPGVLELADFMYDPVVKNGQEISDDDLIARSTVYLQTHTSKDDFTCSGTLIAQDIVMTAAHCLPKGFSSVDVEGQYAGRTFYTKVFAEDTVTHAKYQKKPILLGIGGFSSNHDIALIYLREEVSSPFAAAKLPGKEIRYESKEVILAGHGRTSFKGSDAGVLRAGKTKVSTRMGVSAQLSQVGSISSAAACPGDSGGPVFIKSKDNFVVIGINSWGHCTYGIGYAESVGQHLKWIVHGMAHLRSMKEL